MIFITIVALCVAAFLFVAAVGLALHAAAFMACGLVFAGVAAIAAEHLGIQMGKVALIVFWLVGGSGGAHLLTKFLDRES